LDKIGLNPDDLDRNVYGRMVKTLILQMVPDAKPGFESDSIAAENWLNTLAAVQHLFKGPKPNIDDAYRLLMPTKDHGYNLLDSYLEHDEGLRQMKGKLDAISKAVKEKPFARGEYPVTWSSAHEAAAGLARFALEWFVCPLAGITDQAEQWREAKRLLAVHGKKFAALRNLSPDRVAALEARIRRETAKLLMKLAKQEEIRLLESVLAALTPNQGRIMEYLMTKKTASFDSLQTIPGAFQEGVTDEAIVKQLKDMKRRLDAAKLSVGYITISTSKKRVTLAPPGD
jgi:hypothetical protein